MKNQSDTIQKPREELVKQIELNRSITLIEKNKTICTNENFSKKKTCYAEAAKLTSFILKPKLE